MRLPSVFFIFLSCALFGCSDAGEEQMRTPVDTVSLSEEDMHALLLEAEQGNLRAIERLGDIAAQEGRSRDAQLWRQIAVDLGEPRRTRSLANAFRMGADEATDEVAQRIFLEAATWDRRVERPAIVDQ